MKNFAYNFEFSIDIYNFIIDNVPLYDYRKEKEIFDLLYQGYPCHIIADKTGYSETTIKRRRKSIYEKIKQILTINGINIKDCTVATVNVVDVPQHIGTSLSKDKL